MRTPHNKAHFAVFWCDTNFFFRSPMTELLLNSIHDYSHFAWFIAWAVAFAESLIIVGFFFPGWVLLLTLGALIGAQALPFWPVFFGAYGGAVMGEGLGFVLGSTHSHTIRRSRFLQHHADIVLRAELFFLRFGALALVAGRFIGPIRAVLPFIAGCLHFSPRRYWFINVFSAFFWALAYLLPGMMGAVATHANGRRMTPVLLLLASVLLTTYGAWHWREKSRWLGYLLALTLWLALFTGPWSGDLVAWLAQTLHLLFAH